METKEPGKKVTVKKWAVHRALNGWIVVCGTLNIVYLDQESERLNVFACAEQAASFLRKQMKKYEDSMRADNED